jgi:hypothetical protein
VIPVTAVISARCVSKEDNEESPTDVSDGTGVAREKSYAPHSGRVGHVTPAGWVTTHGYTGRVGHP